MEQHALTTPVTGPTKTTYTIRFILLDWEGKRVEISVVDNTGKVSNKRYDDTTTPTGQSLMVTLNKADLSANSLHRRALNRLATDGVIEVGTVTGTPD